MRYTMVAFGSTGDVRPYILLGQELQKRGHQVKIAAFANFTNIVKEEGLDFYPLTGDAVDFISHVMKPRVSGVSYLRELEQAVRQFIDPMLDDLMVACKDADVLVCTFFGATVYSIAEKYNIPCVQTQFFPMDCNGSVPISSAPGLRLGKAWNKASYKLGYLLINSLEKRYLSDWRSREGMRLRKIKTDPDYIINGHRIPVLYAISPLLLPRPLSWHEQIYMTGFWTDCREEEYSPSPELEAFLADGTPPIYIGFGSMASGDMGETLDIVVDAIGISGVRAVICKGWGGADTQIQHPDIFVTDYLPHGWIFDRVSAVVHHGGVGTMCAGLRAGKPTLIIPFGGDQPFWSLRVRAMRLGPRPIRRENLTVKALARRLRELTANPEYAQNARRMAKALCDEKGTQNAADIIEKEIAIWLAEGETPYHK